MADAGQENAMRRDRDWPPRTVLKSNEQEATEQRKAPLFPLLPHVHFAAHPERCTMIPVISQERWVRWCNEKHLPLARSLFALPTCYYGLGLRSRPGTLLVTDTELIHYSYSWLDTWWAIGEPSVMVSIPFTSICEVRRLRMSAWTAILQLWPDAVFHVVTDEKVSQVRHEFLLQQRGAEFASAIRAMNLPVVNDSLDQLDQS
jgi:hypothetical protein